MRQTKQVRFLQYYTVTSTVLLMSCHWPPSAGRVAISDLMS